MLLSKFERVVVKNKDLLKSKKQADVFLYVIKK